MKISTLKVLQWITGGIAIACLGALIAMSGPACSKKTDHDYEAFRLQQKLERVCSQAKTQSAQAQHWVETDPSRATLGNMIILAFTGVIDECNKP